jgi:HEAT repeat protein
MKAPSILLLLSTIAPLGAQEPASAELQRAILIEEREHDLAQAIELYRKLADAGDLQARLRLGLALRRADKGEEGEALLAQLAKGEGALAERARAALQEKADPLAARIRAQVDRLASERGSPKEVVDEIVWLGARAVPHLIAAIGERRGEGYAVTQLAHVLLRIGGPQVVGWLEDLRANGDPLTVRQVLSAHPPIPMSGGGNPMPIENRIREALIAFVRHPADEVRMEAITQLWPRLSAAQLIEAASDSSPRVAEQAFGVIADYWNGLRHEDGPLTSLERLLPLLEKSLGELNPAIGEKLLAFIGRGSGLLESAQGRSLFLRALRLPVFEPAVSAWNLARANVLPDQHADEILAAARVLGPVDRVLATGVFRPNPRQRALAAVAGALLPYWGERSIDVVADLLAGGYQVAKCEAWLACHGTRRHMPKVAAHLLEAREPGILLGWMAEQGAPPEVFAPLRGYLDDLLAGRLEAPINGPLAPAIGTIDDERTAAYLRGLALERGRWDLAAAGLRSARSEASRAVLRELVVVANADKRSRAEFLKRLVEIADRPAIDLFVEAYRLGLSSVGLEANNGPSPRGLGLALYSACDDWIEPIERYTVADLARLTELCLSTRREDVWSDLLEVRWSSLSAPVLEVIARHVHESALPFGQRRRLVEDLLRDERLAGRSDLAARALANDDTEVQRVAIAELGRRRIDPTPHIPALLELGARAHTAEVLSALRQIGDPAHVAFIRRYLTDGDTAIRRAAVHALIGLLGNAAADELVPLFEQRRIVDATLLCDAAAKLLDTRFVPLLLEARRDPGVDRNDDAVKNALEAIRFYQEQEAHWQRVLRGAGLQANTAAEALVQQAGTDRAKDVRLLAIASLGTLGVPEVLPFLIERAQEADADIAAAARAAIARIQTQGGERK